MPSTKYLDESGLAHYEGTVQGRLDDIAASQGAQDALIEKSWKDVTTGAVVNLLPMKQATFSAGSANTLDDNGWIISDGSTGSIVLNHYGSGSGFFGYLLDSSSEYTLLVEIENMPSGSSPSLVTNITNTTGKRQCALMPKDASGNFISATVLGNDTVYVDGAVTITVPLYFNTTSGNRYTRIQLLTGTLPQGAKIRCSLYEGDYQGDYVPYDYDQPLPMKRRVAELEASQADQDAKITALEDAELTESGSGASVLTDGSGIFGVQGEGFAHQMTTTGKNLLGIDLAYIKSINTDGSWSGNAYTINGVVYTVNEDGSIAIAGTATATSLFSIAQGNRFGMQADTLYALSGVESTIGNCALAITDNTTYSVNVDSVGGYATFITSTVDNAQVYIYVYAAGQINTVLRPQFELGSTATSYEPYTGGIPSPNPSYPQEIRVARGRNLIDSPSHYTGDSEHPYGTSRHTLPIPLHPGTYSFAFNNAVSTSGGAYAVYFYDASDNQIGSATADFVTGANSTTVTISGIATKFDWFINTSYTVSNVQLELGSTPTPYIPYGHIGLEVSGEPVLLEDNWGIDADGTEHYIAGNQVRSIKVNPGSQIQVKLTRTAISSWTLFATYDKFGNFVSAIYTDQHEDAGTFSFFTYIPANATELRVSINAAFGCEVSSATPVPLPSKGFAGAIGDYVDTLEIDSAGGYVWTNKTSDVSMGDLSWHYDTSQSSPFFYVNVNTRLSDRDPNNLYEHGILSVPYRVATSVPVSASDSEYAQNAPDKSVAKHQSAFGSTKYLYVKDSSYSDASTFKTSLSGKHILYAVATTTTEQGYIDLPELPNGATVSIPELEAIGVEWWVADIPEIKEYGQAMQARLQSEIDEAEQAIADNASSIVTLQQSVPQIIEVSYPLSAINAGDRGNLVVSASIPSGKKVISAYFRCNQIANNTGLQITLFGWNSSAVFFQYYAPIYCYGDSTAKCVITCV